MVERWDASMSSGKKSVSIFEEVAKLAKDMENPPPKDPFEKTSDYEKRVNKWKENIDTKIKDKLKEVPVGKAIIDSKNYDADREIFTIKTEIFEELKTQIEIPQEIPLSISPQEAKELFTQAEQEGNIKIQPLVAEFSFNKDKFVVVKCFLLDKRSGKKWSIAKKKRKFGKLLVKSNQEIILTGECTIMEEIEIQKGGTLIIRGAEIIFAENAGIVCEGILIAEDSEFKPIHDQWQNILFYGNTVSGSILQNCIIIKGKGRKGKYINKKYGRGFSEDKTFGGGIWFIETKEADIKLLNCIFDSCSADKGGGMDCFGSNPIIKDCIFKNCSASKNGGGVFCGSSSPNFINCTFTTCSAAWRGSGVYCVWKSKPNLEECIFSNCSAAWRGGGIWADSSSKPKLKNCSFKECKPQDYYLGNIKQYFRWLFT